MSEVLGSAIDLDQTPLAYPPLQTLFPLCLVCCEQFARQTQQASSRHPRVRKINLLQRAAKGGRRCLDDDWTGPVTRTGAAELRYPLRDAIAGRGSSHLGRFL